MKSPSDFDFENNVKNSWTFWCDFEQYMEQEPGLSLKRPHTPVEDAVHISTWAFDCVSDFFVPELLVVGVGWCPDELEPEENPDRTGHFDRVAMSPDVFRDLDVETLRELCDRNGPRPVIGWVKPRVTTNRVYTEHGFRDLQYQRSLPYDIAVGGSERISGCIETVDPVRLYIDFYVSPDGWYGSPEEDHQIYVNFISRIETSEALAGTERLCEINRWRELSGVECLFEQFAGPGSDVRYNDVSIEDVGDPILAPTPPFGKPPKQVKPPFDGPDPERLIQQDRLQWAETAFADAEIVDSAEGERLSVWVDEPAMTDAELRARVETYVADRLDDGREPRLARLRVERASGATLDAALTDDDIVWSR